jgi:surface protein
MYMDYVFKNDYKLKNIDVSKWDTSKVTTCGDIIGDCFEIERLDLSSFTGESCVSVGGFLYFNGSNTAKLKSIDISNMIIREGVSYTKFLYVEHNELANLTDIGMVHCDVRTINIVAGMTPVQPITIWIGTHLTADEIASLDQYDHITYSIQLENAERLLLSSPLLEGDEIKVVDGQLCHVHNMRMLNVNPLEISTSSGNNKYFYIPIRDLDHKLYDNVYGYGICNYGIIADPSLIDEIEDYVIENNQIFIGGSGIGISFGAVNNVSLTDLRNRVAKEPLTVVYELAEPYTEVIDLPNESIDLPLYENGVLHMSDPTASTNRVDSNGRMLIDAVQGDSVVNVSNQQFSIELSEETNTPIQTGEITEDSSIRPKFYGRTMVNLMDRIGWEKYTPEYGYVAYIYRPTDITNKSITITNFNDKPIRIGIFNTDDNNADNRTVTIDAKSTNVIVLSSVESLFSIAGLADNGWTEENMHELKNVNIFEGELSEDELPENRMSGMRNTFDKYQTSEGKYRVEMVVSNSPIQFGKAGRK